MRVDLFDFELPQERIALRPARPRDSARMLVAKETGNTANSWCFSVEDFGSREFTYSTRLLMAEEILRINARITSSV